MNVIGGPFYCLQACIRARLFPADGPEELKEPECGFSTRTGRRPRSTHFVTKIPVCHCSYIWQPASENSESFSLSHWWRDEGVSTLVRVENTRLYFCRATTWIQARFCSGIYATCCLWSRTMDCFRWLDQRAFQAVKVRSIQITTICSYETLSFWKNLYTEIKSIALFSNNHLLLDPSYVT